jgi:iron complex transport system substrate-binding protein
VIGGESYLDQLTRLAGARNVFHDLPAASTVVSLETLVVRDPDVIVTLADSAPPPGPPAFARRREWRAVRAVRAGRFVVLAGSLFGRPSPRAALAVAEMRRLLSGPGTP